MKQWQTRPPRSPPPLLPSTVTPPKNTGENQGDSARVLLLLFQFISVAGVIGVLACLTGARRGKGDSHEAGKHVSVLLPNPLPRIPARCPRACANTQILRKGTEVLTGPLLSLRREEVIFKRRDEKNSLPERLHVKLRIFQWVHFPYIIKKSF